MRIKDRVILSEEECLDTISKWRVILGLEDWEIQMLYVSVPEMDEMQVDRELSPSMGARASADIDFFNKIMVLTVAYPSEEEADAAVILPWDMERSIVHELLHITFAHAAQMYYGATGYTKESIVALEQSVEAMANALIMAKRGYYDQLT